MKMDIMDEKDVNKTHRVSKTGRKAEKKKLKSQPPDPNLTPKQRNPKAFAIQNAVRAERGFRRKMDIKTKRQHIPQVDHTPLQPPPLIVAVVGPPKVGKSTLIRCLVKNFTRQNMSEIRGPVTVVSGKKKRLTILECNNDINAMIDIAKIADLVLLLVDASFGFEMEIFEFLNICQIHGFPRIMGVLTHLDHYRDNKQLRKMKKSLKHRFWTEIYPGAKLFYLSGMIRDEYQRTEIHNLGRFISVNKTRPIQWRTTHPYLLADRMEDLTDPEIIRHHPKSDRTVCFYGYSRGANFRNHNSIHIPGCGDFVIKDISFLHDPCPLPDKEKKRSLNEKEKLIYAPFSGVGGIVYDKDAVYIDVGGSHSHTENKAENSGLLNELVTSLIDSRNTLHNKVASSQLQIFTNAKTITSKDHEQDVDFQDSMEQDSEIIGRKRRRVIFDDEEGEVNDDEVAQDSDDDVEQDSDGETHSLVDSDNDEEQSEDSYEDEDNYAKLSKSGKRRNDDSEISEVKFKRRKSPADSIGDSVIGNKVEMHENVIAKINSNSGLKWKDGLLAKAATAFYDRQRSVPNLRKLIYGKQNEITSGRSETNSEEIGGLFKVLRDTNKSKSEDNVIMNSMDCTKFVVPEMQDWNSESIIEKIKDSFVTGKWKDNEDAQTLLNRDDDLFGDFEDLENEDKSEAVNDSSKEEKTSDDKKQITQETRLEKKKRLKENFDKEYDDQGDSAYYDDLKNDLDQQSQLNKSEFVNMDDDLRVQLEGFRPGMYLRVEVSNVPCELVSNFDPQFPVILGGLQCGEENIGYVNIRLKKHRWHKKILKTRDPVIISLGWRRFQTLPLYCIQDHNGRCRLLKYTPEHLHCLTAFWGPITPQGTGCLAIQSVADVTPNFRIAATGIVTELDKSTQIEKKLKLTGIPFKIYKKTAFIRGMFNTSLEVAKFEKTPIKTVSGVRGEIKKALKAPEGSFRATFEDKILMSDIVFARVWYKVQVPQFYNPVTSMLLPLNEKCNWRGMRTLGQLRRDYNVPLPYNEDSIYKPVERIQRAFHPLVIPKSLQKGLPYKDKPKTLSDKTKISLDEQRVAVIQEPQEKKVSNLMKMIKTAYQVKQRQEKEAMKSRVVKHKKALEEIEWRKTAKQKLIRKQLHRTRGQRQGNGKPAASS